jgi:predicted permease
LRADGFQIGNRQSVIGNNDMETLFNDLRYGAKMLWKNKGVTVVAVVSLAVGIGANTAIFSMVNSLLLRPRPVSKPEQLVELYTGELQHPYETTSYPSYLDFRARNDVFTGLAAYGISQFKLGGMNQVEQVWGEAVSGNYFDVLGVPAHKGRTFAAEEDLVPGRNPVVVISYGLWQRRFDSDPALIGKTVTVNNQELTVIGIAPPQYTGMLRGLASEVWIPTMMMPLLEPNKGQTLLGSRGSRWVLLVGRLKPDATLAQARARFDLLSREMQATHPEEWKSKWPPESGAVRELFVSVLPESETRVHPDMQTSVYALAGLLVVIVNLVLVIACMNLASMLLARALVRRKEIAVRLALGASRTRIIRQLLTESVLLSLIAGAAGLVFAVWLLDLVLAFMPALPEGIRIALDLRLDWHVPVYAIAFSTITGVLFGLAPALHSSKADVSTVLKDDSSAFTGRYRKSRVRQSLVVAQVAFSLLLLIGAGLVLRSLEKVRPTRLGFSSDNVLVAPVVLDETQYDRGKSQEFFRQLSERVSSLPGVQAASLVDRVLGGFMGSARRSTEIEGYQASAGEDMQIDFAMVGPNYFTNMKVPFAKGRDFDDRDRDGAPCVAIVNETFAQRYFSGIGSPLGKHLAKFGRGPKEPKQMCEIVGVIHDNQWQSLEKVVRPFYFLALQQSEQRRMTLLVSSAGDPASLIQPVRRAIQQLDPNMPVNDVQTLREYFSVGLYPFRLLGVVMGACGVMALLLATVGIYGVVSYSVAQRQREVGIRIALGALQRDILRMVVGQGMILVGYGLGAGLLLGLVLTRVLTSSLFDTELLFGVTATDSLTFAGVTALLAFVALVACYVPARRATKVNLLVALRYE